MAIDEIQAQQETNPPAGPSHSGTFIAVFVVLAGLAVGEIYTLSQISSMHGSVESTIAQFQKDQQEVMSRFSNHVSAEAQEHTALRTELEASSKRLGSTGGELRKARAMVADLESQEKQQAESLKQEIAKKADQEQVGALSQDVSSTKTDLDGTKKSVDTLRSDLGMAKSELGTLIARNHDDLETLRKMGERDYFEFSLDRKHPQKVAGVGLVLKKTNPKAHKFSVVLQANDVEVEKKDRTVNEPIVFLVGTEKKPYELVVNKVQPDKVVGYVSAPKGATEVATSSGGAQ
jgi:hypothetical protein